MGDLDFEVMDRKSIEYAKEQTAITTRKFHTYYENTKKIIRPYVFTEKIRGISITQNKICFISINNGKHNLVVNKNIVYSTEGLIVWIKAENNGDRIALFETNGKDSGTLKIFKGNNLLYSEDGFIHDVIFTSENFYIVKENRNEQTGSSNTGSNAVYFNNKYVFGKEIPAGMGIQGDSFGDTIVLTVEDNSRTIIYTGNLNNPSTWKQFREYNKQVKVMGYDNDRLYALIFDGNGIIAAGDEEFTVQEPVQDAVLVKDAILTVCMRDAKSVPVLYNTDGRQLKEFAFNQPLGLISMDSDKNNALLVLSSFGTPYEIYRYENEQLKKIESNNVSEVNTEEHFIPMENYKVHYFFLRAHAESNNTVVYGYGGFNISLVPSYNNLFAYLLDHGVNVVICNLPGGGEYGEDWHRIGKGKNKINVYSSFQEIIKELYKSGQRIICYGVSNGGLLSSYTLTAIPQFLAGAVIGNPVTDLMKFHKFLAGKYWTSEYGNPDNSEDAIFLTKYSSMHNIKNIEYPPALVYSRLEDDRVHPYHAMAFYEKLRNTGSNAYLLMGKGGHLGAGLDDMASETAYIASFIEYVFKIQEMHE